MAKLTRQSQVLIEGLNINSVVELLNQNGSGQKRGTVSHQFVVPLTGIEPVRELPPEGF